MAILSDEHLKLSGHARQLADRIRWQSHGKQQDGPFMRILLVEDDSILGAAVRDHIVASNHSVDWVTRLDAATAYLESAAYDLVLLDMMLPDGQGISFLRSMRMKGCATPVIILTALDQISDRIQGLNAGADDYMTKPFDLSELSARLNAVARRYRPRGEDGRTWRPVDRSDCARMGAVRGLRAPPRPGHVQGAA